MKNNTRSYFLIENSILNNLKTEITDYDVNLILEYQKSNKVPSNISYIPFIEKSLASVWYQIENKKPTAFSSNFDSIVSFSEDKDFDRLYKLQDLAANLEQQIKNANLKHEILEDKKQSLNKLKNSISKLEEKLNILPEVILEEIKTTTSKAKREPRLVQAPKPVKKKLSLDIYTPDEFESIERLSSLRPLAKQKAFSTGEFIRNRHKTLAKMYEERYNARLGVLGGYAQDKKRALWEARTKKILRLVNNEARSSQSTDLKYQLQEVLGKKDSDIFKEKLKLRKRLIGGIRNAQFQQVINPLLGLDNNLKPLPNETEILNSFTISKLKKNYINQLKNNTTLSKGEKEKLNSLISNLEEKNNINSINTRIALIKENKSTAFDTERLIVTEMTAAYNIATFLDSDAQYFKWSIALEHERRNVVCLVCYERSSGGYFNQGIYPRYKIEQVLELQIPQHPFCLCRYIPLDDDHPMVQNIKQLSKEDKLAYEQSMDNWKNISSKWSSLTNIAKNTALTAVSIAALWFAAKQFKSLNKVASPQPQAPNVPPTVTPLKFPTLEIPAGLGLPELLTTENVDTLQSLLELPDSLQELVTVDQVSKAHRDSLLSLEAPLPDDISTPNAQNYPIEKLDSTLDETTKRKINTDPDQQQVSAYPTLSNLVKIADRGLRRTHKNTLDKLTDELLTIQTINPDNNVSLISDLNYLDNLRSAIVKSLNLIKTFEAEARESILKSGSKNTSFDFEGIGFPFGTKNKPESTVAFLQNMVRGSDSDLGVENILSRNKKLELDLRKSYQDIDTQISNLEQSAKATIKKREILEPLKTITKDSKVSTLSKADIIDLSFKTDPITVVGTNPLKDARLGLLESNLTDALSTLRLIEKNNYKPFKEIRSSIYDFLKDSKRLNLFEIKNELIPQLKSFSKSINKELIENENYILKIINTLENPNLDSTIRTSLEKSSKKLQFRNLYLQTTQKKIEIFNSLYSDLQREGQYLNRNSLIQNLSPKSPRITKIRDLQDRILKLESPYSDKNIPPNVASKIKNLQEQIRIIQVAEFRKYDNLHNHNFNILFSKFV